MIELRTYTKPELSAIFGTGNKRSLQQKMTRYGISFEVQGRGETATFAITALEFPFKVYCITDLDFDGRTDFKKVRNFYHYFFNDEEFMAMPNEVKEYRMRLQGQDVSRQTIANYISKLQRRNLIETNTSEYIYYFAYRQNQIITDRQTYSQAWREYWREIKHGSHSMEAISNMINKYGGVARKQCVPAINGIYLNEIENLQNLIQESIEKDVDIYNQVIDLTLII